MAGPSRFSFFQKLCFSWMNPVVAQVGCAHQRAVLSMPACILLTAG